jgi:hypothetical protein
MIFIPEVFAAGAIEVDGGNGCHGRKGKEKLAPREPTIQAGGAWIAPCNNCLQKPAQT